MADYLLTNPLHRRSPLIEAHGPAHVMDVLWQVRAALLDAAFATMETDCCDLARYLEEVIDVGSSELDRQASVCWNREIRLRHMP